MGNLISFIPAPGFATFLDFQRHFLERTLNLEAYRGVIIGVSIVVGILVLATLVIHFWPKKPYVPRDWVVGQEEIRAILTTAFNQRAKIELHFALEGETRRPALRCSGVAVEKNSTLLEASGMTVLSPRWQGRRVDCFFMLRRQESYSFFAFTTTITEIDTHSDLSVIRLTLPERLESRQKRSYLRITPPEEYMLGAAVWRGPDMPEQPAWNDLSLWAKPSRLWLPGTREDFTLRDISSGGLKLHLPRHILAEEMDFAHVSTQFIVMLDLWEPDKANRLRFWLLCRMQSPVLDFETKGMDLGAQFLAWAKPADHGSSALVWLKLASSGEVEPLGNWIMRRHLEFFRESEQSVKFGQRQTA